MPRLSIETRQRVVTWWQCGVTIKEVHQRLKDEGVQISKTSLSLLVKKFKNTGLIKDKHRTPKPTILTRQHYEFIDDVMSKNDELTTHNLWVKLKENFPSLQLSLSTVRRARKDLGWVSTTPHYCQLIREANKEKRLKWCKEMRDAKETFSDVIWTDESSVEITQHSLKCYRRKGQPKTMKPRPKHPLKVHVWGGISSYGATPIIIFTGILVATKLTKIFETGLIPFVQKVFPAHHRLMQDNDPKHSSKLATAYLQDNGVMWWKTPPESPDLNPIENVWGSMKRYLRDKHKPTNLETLIEGIKSFWKTLTPEVCRKYIGHIYKVIPKVIEENGGPSGY